MTPESMNQCWMRWWMSKRITARVASGEAPCPGFFESRMRSS